MFDSVIEYVITSSIAHNILSQKTKNAIVNTKFRICICFIYDFLNINALRNMGTSKNARQGIRNITLLSNSCWKQQFGYFQPRILVS